MKLVDVIRFLGWWSLFGALLFSAFVIFAFRSGLVYAAREEDGLLKERIPWQGLVAMGSFVLTIVAFFILANAVGLTGRGYAPGFGELFLLNFALYLLLFLFDTLVIDGLVLAYWRPRFLRLPAALGRDSMRTHIVKSLPVGLVIGLFLCAISTLLSWLLLPR